MSVPIASPPTATQKRLDSRGVVIWLSVVYLMIFLMVVIGGTTRLTGSGLSIVEWRPLMGAIPPTSDAEWHTLFSQYQQFPQYKLVNSWMDLASFKRIFFWEYLHRLWGRLIGVVVLVPWIYFVVTRRLSRSTSRGALFGVLLGGAQGVLGWYMVKSGLVDVPAVSHFRLAAHLVLALIVSQWFIWLILNLKAPWLGKAPLSVGLPTAGGLLAVLYLQIILGAFVAGKRAGLMSSTFPDMNGHYLPDPFFNEGNILSEIATNPFAMHYTHRAIGTLLALAFLLTGAFIVKRSTARADRMLGVSLVGVVLLQFTLGALTVIHLVPVGWAVAHQGVAVILVGLTTALLHRQWGAFRPN